MFTIQINKLHLYGYHGVHEEETILGSNFEVNISVSFKEAGLIVSLDETINYVSVFEIVKSHFTTPQKLLETLAQNIVQAIYLLDKKTETINISIEKLNPPIANFTGAVCVQFSKTFI
jgi:7,8-dihydroneopterin aldolase/epimerase/oxygenase